MAPPGEVASEPALASQRSIGDDKPYVNITEMKATSSSISNSDTNVYTPKLQFVLGQDKESRKLARSHLVREVRRKKGLKESSPRQSNDEKGVLSRKHAEQGSPDLSTAAENMGGGQDHGKLVESSQVRICSSLLGPGNKDLFAAFPVVQYSDSNLLTGDYLSMLGYQMFGASVRSEFNPFRDIIFALAMEDPPSFEVVVALAAAHNDALHQREIGAETALHKMKALRLINDRLSGNGDAVDDGTIFSISALWCLEVHYGNEVAIRSHIDGLRQIIINRGGLGSLEANPKLQMILMWCILTLPGVMTFGTSQMLETSDEKMLDSCRGEVNHFFEQVHTLSTSSSSPYEAESFAFQPGLPLERLLSGSGLPRVGQYRVTLARDLQAICRLAILLYIHSIFLDYHALPQIIQRQMKRVRAKIVEHELDRHLNVESIELLLWILFKDDKATRIENAARTWRVARMMSFAKSASRPWLVNAGELLFSYLQGRKNSLGDVQALQIDRPGEGLWGFRVKKVHDLHR